MRTFQKTIFVALFLLLLNCPFITYSQDSSWGIGFLEISFNVHSINLYDAPGGQKTGTLSKESDGFDLPKWYGNRFSLAIPSDAWKKINMDLYGMIVYQEQDNFIQIISLDEDTPVWASLEEIQKSPTNYFTWSSYMIQSRETMHTIGYGMNVRAEPSPNAKKLGTAKGDHFDIRLTGKIKGLWAEVVIEEYDNEYCSNHRKLKNKYKGWMKILDDKGYPNIWSAGTCC